MGQAFLDVDRSFKEEFVPRPHTDMRKIREVLRLRLGEGLSLRLIHSSLSIPVTTVGDYVRRARNAGLSWPLPDDLSDDELEKMLFSNTSPSREVRPMPDWAKIHLELRRPHVTLMLLWYEYKEAYPHGYGYSQFCEHYKRFASKVDVVMRQHHKAGEKLWVDFSGGKVPIYDTKLLTVVTEAELFVAAIGVSGLIYAEALPSQELMYWIDAHVRTFEFAGGSSHLLIPDNLRSGVTRSNRYEPEINATYAEMAAHYGAVVIPARPLRPRDKSKAENSVLLAQRWILARTRNERFASISEANIAIRGLVEQINNRPFKVLPGSRRSVFEEIDKPHLLPLPQNRYEFAVWKTVRVGLDYHIEVRSDRHFYSVPYRLAKEKVDLRVSAKTIEIFHKSKRIATHPRSQVRFGYTTDPAHMPESHRRYLSWTPQRIISWAEKTGPHTAQMTKAVMETRRHPEQGYRSCLGIIRLGNSYGAARLEAACARALAIRAYSYRSIESILKTGLDSKPLSETSQRTAPGHKNIRGASYYK